jgi:fructosamine-3-kinase
MLDIAARRLDQSTVAAVEAVMRRCSAGDFDDHDAPARIHGDLWNGNVMWTSGEVILIDPAAHGGHRETDLAMLELFGCPHLNAVIDGYHEAHRLQADRRSRVGLHQLYPLLAHVALFGGGYARQVAEAARSALEIS